MKTEEIEDVYLTDNIKKTNDEESLNILIDKHSPICYTVYKKYAPALEASGVYINDIIADKNYMIYKSAISFDKNKKSKFSTWLYNQIRYQCLNCINKKSNTINFENSDLEKIINKNPININDNNILEDSDYIKHIIQSLGDDRIKKIFRLRYCGGKKCMPWKKIGKKLNLSTQTVINLHNKAISLLKNKLNSKNSFDKI